MSQEVKPVIKAMTKEGYEVYVHYIISAWKRKKGMVMAVVGKKKCTRHVKLLNA